MGGGNPVVVQSMTKTNTTDVRATLAQIRRLAKEGCELVRVAVPDRRALACLGEIVGKSPVPVIADIHYSSGLAIGSLEAGAACVRVNPGNLGGRGEFRKVALAARRLGRAVRIGVNEGSLDPAIIRKRDLSASEKMVESAMLYLETAGKTGLEDVKLSLKSSDVINTIGAYKAIAQRTDLPLHIGITEAGDVFSGSIRSGVGLGILLAGGIGDTIRVSLTAPPETEVRAAWEILRSLGLRKRGVELISCPTCSRCEQDTMKIVEKVRKQTAGIEKPMRVAVMGCGVNGPGECEASDAGLVMAASGRALLYVGGKVVGRVPAASAADELAAAVNKLAVPKGGE